MPLQERAIITFKLEAKSGSAIARTLRFFRLTWRMALRTRARNRSANGGFDGEATTRQSCSDAACSV